jgi:hypothetical protein
MSTPLNFLQASVRADELVANQKMGIGVSGQSSQLHIKASAPEISLEDRVGAADSETATRIYANAGSTYIQSGVDFADGSSSNIVFGSMGNTTEFVNIGAHGIETTGNLFVNNLQFTQTQGLDQILNVSNTTSNIMTLTNTSDDALNVAGGMTLGSNLAVNTDDLFVDTTTGNVGVGTTDPGTKLHLHNSSSSTSHQMLSIENPYVFGFNTGQDIGSSIVYRSRWQGDGLSDPVDMCTIEGRKEADANYGDSYIAFKTRYETDRNNGGAGTLSEKMRISGDGNVGIGTASPSAKLQVGGNAETAPQYLWIRGHRVNEAGEISGIHFYNSQISGDRGNSRIINSRGTNNYGSNLEFWTNPDSNVPALERMRILANGNVGIGSASPEYPLSFTRAGFAVNVSVVNPMSTAGIGAFNFGDLHVGDNVVTECICIYNPTAENSYGYKCGYVQWIQMKVRGQGIQDTIQIIKSYSADSSTVTVTAGTGSASHNTILTVSNGVADISYTARVFYRALDTP